MIGWLLLLLLPFNNGSEQQMARFADGLQRDLEAADQSVNWSIEHHPLQQNGEAPWEPQASHERHEIIIHIPDKEGHRSGITPTTSWHSQDHEKMASPVEILDNGFNKEDGSQVGKISQINHEECAICLSDFDSESDTIALDCKHLFHKHCINCWLYKGSPPYTCPACRDPLRQGGRTPPVPEHCPEGLPETPVMVQQVNLVSIFHHDNLPDRWFDVIAKGNILGLILAITILAILLIHIIPRLSS